MDQSDHVMSLVTLSTTTPIADSLSEEVTALTRAIAEKGNHLRAFIPFCDGNFQKFVEMAASALQVPQIPPAAQSALLLIFLSPQDVENVHQSKPSKPTGDDSTLEQNTLKQWRALLVPSLGPRFANTTPHLAKALEEMIKADHTLSKDKEALYFQTVWSDVTGRFPPLWAQNSLESLVLWAQSSSRPNVLFDSSEDCKFVAACNEQVFNTLDSWWLPELCTASEILPYFFKRQSWYGFTDLDINQALWASFLRSGILFKGNAHQYLTSLSRGLQLSMFLSQSRQAPPKEFASMLDAIAKASGTTKYGVRANDVSMGSAVYGIFPVKIPTVGKQRPLPPPPKPKKRFFPFKRGYCGRKPNLPPHQKQHGQKQPQQQTFTTLKDFFGDL